jgi:hypothetical protein
VQGKLKGLEAVFVPDSAGNENPQLSFCAPDLRTAVWLQAASLIDRKRPMKICEECEQPFPLTRSDKKTCSERCRKRKSLRSRGG